MQYFLCAPHLGQSASEQVTIIMKLQGEKKPQQVAKDLDQWVKKMKCSGTSGVGIESFADIRVGIDHSPVNENINMVLSMWSILQGDT